MPSTIDAGQYSIAYRGIWRQSNHTIKAGETFDVDTLVYLDSNGQLVAAAAAGNAVGAIKPLGFAMGNAMRLLAAGLKCPVKVITSQSEVRLPVYHGTTASAVVNENETDTPLTLPLKVLSSGLLVADKENNGTNDLIVWTDRCLEYEFGETFGLHWWAFKDGVTLREGS